MLICLIMQKIMFVGSFALYAFVVYGCSYGERYDEMKVPITSFL
jgi:hypothetical protein